MLFNMGKKSYDFDSVFERHTIGMIFMVVFIFMALIGGISLVILFLARVIGG